MITSSRRIRTEEKRLVRKVLITLGSIVGAIIFVLYIGLPLLARVLLFGNSSSVPTTKTDAALVFPPVFDPLPEATNAATIHLSGYAQKDTQIQLIVNDKEDKLLQVDGEGRFFAPKLNLNEGDNTIGAVAILGDSRSTISAQLKVRYVKSEPKLEITSPTDGEKFSGDLRNITIRGTTDRGNRVTVNDRVAIMDQRGGFSLSLRLSDGETTLKIIAQDPAGNQATKEIKVHYSS